MKTIFKKVIPMLLLTAFTFSILTGCSMEPTREQIVQQEMANKEQEKAEQAVKMMDTVKAPEFNYSTERENIALRLKSTNNPTTVGWIYTMSAGRVLGRFPVRGKVTSGSKRLTNTVMKVKIENGYKEVYIPAPDETGAYGDSGEYIFWFDPSGNYHQHRGDYSFSTIPYQLDVGNGVITSVIDKSEMSKKEQYEKDAKESYNEDMKSISSNKEGE